MFVDSKPTSLYSRTSDSDMENPVPQLRRPPAILNHSSSSLIGLERSVPAFQSFVKRTPPPNHEKPLPPVPDRQTRLYSSDFNRRTSSIYSRTVSQYAPTPEPWEQKHLLLPSLFLQPSVYSLSTPELTLDGPSERLAPVARPCAPLFASPSPSPSRISTPSPPADLRRVVLRPSSPPAPLNLMTRHIKTVSLDKAKAALRSPGVQPLLPEEMRALAAEKKAKERMLRTSHSFEGVVVESPRLYPTYLMSPSFPSASDKEWSLQPEQRSNKTDSKLSDDYFGISKEDRTALAPVEIQIRDPIDIRVQRTSDPISHDFEPRGRARVKSGNISSRRSADAEKPIQEVHSNESLINEAQRLANEYHALFKEQFKSPTQRRKTSASSTSVKESMKLVPQPLFFNPRQVSKQRTRQYQRELNQLRYIPAAKSRTSAPRVALKEQQPSPSRNQFPFKLSLTPESTTSARRRRSTSGSIPISPPFASTNFSNAPKSAESVESPVRKRSIDDSSRFSAFYQRINADAEQLAKEYASPSSVAREANTLPRIPAEHDTSSMRGSSVAPSFRSHLRRISSNESGAASIASSKVSKAPLKSSMHKGFAAVSSVFNVRKSSATAVEGISTLVDTLKQRRPSFPVISSPLPVSSAPEASVSPMAPVMSKRPSLFNSIRDHKRESKASKRREELKKTIKVVPGTMIPEMRSVTTPPKDVVQDGEWL